MDTTTDAPTEYETDADWHEAEAKRLSRAISQDMEIDAGEYRTPDVFAVRSQSGSEYVVNVRAGECSCPDYQNRGIACKHLLRTVIEAGVDPLAGGRCGCGACGRPTFCMAHGV